MKWHRVRVADKMAFREDLQSDPTLTDLQKRMISTIATHWDNAKMQAECSESFIARGAGTTTKMVKRYKASIAVGGRVSIKRPPTHTESTMWSVNWWFRGSAWIRHTNGGNPIQDCRKVVPVNAHGVVPNTAHEVVPVNAHGVVPNTASGWSPSGDPIPTLQVDIGAPEGARPYGGAQGAPKEKKDNPHRPQAGFAKWKIIHAEYCGEDEESFVAHLRSGTNRKFVLRCHIDDDDYESLDHALDLGGEAENAIGEMVQMSTNRDGRKSFLRAAPLPWREVTVLAGESNADGSARLHVEFNDEHGGQAHIALSSRCAASLVETCGSEEDAIGARVRYRLLPDDTMEFRLIEAAMEAAA